MVGTRVSQPIVLLGAPRSGTTMLFNVLSGHPDLWSLYRESDLIIEKFFPVRMEPGCSDVVESDEVSDECAAEIAQAFVTSVGNMGSGHFALSNAMSSFLRTATGRRLVQLPGVSKLRLSMIFSRMGSQKDLKTIRVVEKTPENCFRVQMLERVFPDARYIFLTRDPRKSIASIYTGWTESDEFSRFEFPRDFAIEEYRGSSWCFGLIPGWEDLNGAELIEVCARQWLSYNIRCRTDLPTDADRSLTVSYEDLVAGPGELLDRIADWSGLDRKPFERFRESLPVVNTFTNPRDDKWRKLEEQIKTVEPVFGDEASRLGYQI
jgi:Sulfotransferase family